MAPRPVWLRRTWLPQVPALAELNQYAPHWLWIWCPKCHHHVAAPIAPFVIRFGPEASSGVGTVGAFAAEIAAR